MTDRAKFTLEEATQYIEAWDRHPALELGGQATVYVHDMLRAMIELARKARLEGNL